MSFAELIETAACAVLLPPGEDDHQRGPYSGYKYHRYSCNAILFAPEKATAESVAASEWYYNEILCADRPMFRAGTPLEECGREAQNVRFMLLLFASYFAADEGL